MAWVVVKVEALVRGSRMIGHGLSPRGRALGAAPILAWQDCKYIATVHYPDTVEIGVKVVELLEDRFKMESKILCKS